MSDPDAPAAQPPGPETPPDESERAPDSIEAVATTVPGPELAARVAAAGEFLDLASVGLDLSRRTIPGDVTFRRSFLRKATFKRAKFQGAVLFKDCTLEDVRFHGAEFEKGVTFEECEFRRTPRMSWISSKGPFVLRNCLFTGKVSFEKCAFGDRFDAWDTRFQGWLDLFDSTWEREADLRSATCSEGLVFRRGTIRGSLLLRGTTVQKKFAIEGTEIGGCLDLSKAKLHDFSYLEDLKLGPNGSIRLWNSILRALLLRPEQVTGRLASAREEDWEVAAQELGVLKTNYSALNWFDEEDWAYYEFKRARWKARAKKKEGGFAGRASRFFERVIFDWACGYGTMPMRVLAASLLVIVGFAALYCLPYLAGGVPSYDFAGPGAVLAPYQLTGVPAIDGILTALLDSTSTFVSGFDGVDKNVEGWLAVALTLEGLSGMLLLGLFIVSFSRKVIR